MAGRYLAAVATFAAISISFSYIIPQAAAHLSETLPSSLNAVNRMTPDESINYQAPIHPPHPGNEVVPNSYLIMLAPGASFEQHKQAIRDELDLDGLVTITSTFGEWYSGEFDDSQLTIIRADRNVAHVECNFVFQVNDKVVKYLAPLHPPDPGNEVIPNSYLIMLAPGSSFEEHKQAIGDKLDLDGLIDSALWPASFSDGQVFYAAKFDDAQLAIVRADLNVAHLECSFKIKTNDGPVKGRGRMGAVR